MTHEDEPNIWVKKITQNLGKNIKNNPIKRPNGLNPALGLKKITQHFLEYTYYTFTTLQYCRTALTQSHNCGTLIGLKKITQHFLEYTYYTFTTLQYCRTALTQSHNVIQD